MNTTNNLEKKRYDKLTRDVFRLLHKRRPGKSDQEVLEFILKQLYITPDCFQENAHNVVGWMYHLEFEYSPWQDDDNLYYKDESYVQKKYLSQSKKYGMYNLKSEVFNDLLCNKLKS